MVKREWKDFGGFRPTLEAAEARCEDVDPIRTVSCLLRFGRSDLLE